MSLCPRCKKEEKYKLSSYCRECSKEIAKAKYDEKKKSHCTVISSTQYMYTLIELKMIQREAYRSIFRLWVKTGTLHDYDPIRTINDYQTQRKRNAIPAIAR